MSSLLHVCLYNVEPAASPELRKHISSLNFVRLVSEANTPELLAKTLEEGGTHLVFFHLDPDAGVVVDVIDQVSRRYPDLALIAISHQSDRNAIIEPMRAGCEQFVCEPIEDVDLANAVARVASRRLASRTKSRCLCVIGASGGTGATSIACNLALEIAHRSERECGLIDLDLQFGDCAINFDSEPKYNIFDVADSGGDVDRSLLASTVSTFACKVALLSRPELMEQDEQISPEVIHRVIDVMVSMYENVVVDVPGALTPRTMAALGQADRILVVCQLLVPSLRNAKRLFDAFLRFGIPPDRVEVVVNRTDGRSGRVTVKDLEETIHKPVFACIPNDYQFVARSIDFGRPIASLDRNSPVRAAIRQMAERLLSDASESSPDSKARSRPRGFLGRLLTK